MFRPKHEADWEVVESKEIAQVPTYYEDEDIEFLSVFPHNVSRTYTFDSASPSSSPSSSPKSATRKLQPPTTPSPPSRSPSKRFSRVSSFGSTHLHFCFKRQPSRPPSRASGSSSSDTDESSSEYKWETSRPMAGFSPAQTRSALQFARSQLLKSEELTKVGANALLSERWSVTRLRKGEHHRLQITYTGRPARLAIALPLDPSPPFMDLLATL